jgi:hypothetical protein
MVPHNKAFMCRVGSRLLLFDPRTPDNILYLS